MTAIPLAPEIRGEILRFTWDGGPTKGESHQHTFHEDGTVEWVTVGDAKTAPGKQATKPSDKPKERPRYAAVKVTDDVFAISYLAPSGYTLTVVLNFDDHSLTGFASNDTQWFPTQGSFTVVARDE
jgi:hypothetical protein